MLQLNHSVPANCTAHAEPGDVPWGPHQNRRPRRVAARKAVDRLGYCRNAADVKNSEPMKNVNEVARKPAASE